MMIRAHGDLMLPGALVSVKYGMLDGVSGKTRARARWCHRSYGHSRSNKRPHLLLITLEAASLRNMPRQPFSPSYHHASPSSSAVYVDSIDPAQLSMPAVEQTSPSTSSRLKLILPPLKGGKPIKGQKKKGQEKVKGPPRPTKLKPLKEVLARLISQIKK